MGKLFWGPKNATSCTLNIPLWGPTNATSFTQNIPLWGPTDANPCIQNIPFCSPTNATSCTQNIPFLSLSIYVSIPSLPVLLWPTSVASPLWQFGVISYRNTKTQNNTRNCSASQSSTQISDAGTTRHDTTHCRHAQYFLKVRRTSFWMSGEPEVASPCTHHRSSSLLFGLATISFLPQEWTTNIIPQLISRRYSSPCVFSASWCRATWLIGVGYWKSEVTAKSSVASPKMAAAVTRELRYWRSGEDAVRGVVTANGRQRAGSKTIQLVSLLPVESGNPASIVVISRMSVTSEMNTSS